MYRQINNHLGIQDPDGMKRWMRIYREKGDLGLLDQRGRRKDYLDQERYNQQSKRENAMRKKRLEIWMREGKNITSSSLNEQRTSAK